MKIVNVTVALAAVGILAGAAGSAQASPKAPIQGRMGMGRRMESPKPLPAPDRKANAQMKAVLVELARLTPVPLYKMTPAQVRRQPGPADAVKAVLKKQGRSTSPEPVAKVENRTIPGPAGRIPVRVYTPSGNGPKPVLVYFHGGGWVIANIQAYDSSCRALANAADCVVVSVGYRQAPEHKFPAAHEDSYAATQYVLGHASEFGGDPARIAVGGESAGGNLAAAVCLMAKQRGGKMPIHQLNVYPIAGTDLTTPSYRENADAIPLSRPFMRWFFKHALATPSDARCTSCAASWAATSRSRRRSRSASGSSGCCARGARRWRRGSGN